MRACLTGGRVLQSDGAMRTHFFVLTILITHTHYQTHWGLDNGRIQPRRVMFN